MVTYPADTPRFQSEYRGLTLTILAWLQRQCDAHRLRRAARRNRQILSRLDQRTLADIGAMPETNANLPGQIACFSVQAMVASAIAERIARP